MAFLTLNTDKTIFYKLLNPELQNPVLVFLHEGLGCTEMWGDFPDQLCERCQCPGLVYDRWGYGRSSILTRKRTIRYLHDYAYLELPDVLDFVIPDRHFILIGHSDGGSISLLYGSQQPDLLKGTITEAAHVFVDQLTLEGIIAATKAYDANKLTGLNKYHKEKTDTIFKAWSDTWLSTEFKDWNIETEISPFNAPLLVIQGIDDQYGTVEQVNSICRHVSGEATACMIEACGHTPHADQKEVVLEKMEIFIKGILNNYND